MEIKDIFLIFLVSAALLASASILLRLLIKTYYEKSTEAYQNKLVKNQIEEVNNVYMTMRGWRHDYRNHIQVLKSYAKDGDLAQISKYLDELDEDLSTVDTVIKTGNKMTDAILNSKISLAKSKHIPVVADAHVPVALKTSEMDLCIIIGNLFDNAIEASLQLPEEKRMIRIYMDMKNTQLYMSFTNFTATKKQKKMLAFSGRICYHILRCHCMASILPWIGGAANG